MNDSEDFVLEDLRAFCSGTYLCVTMFSNSVRNASYGRKVEAG